MTKQEKLLNKYYNGETSLIEEKELKVLFLEDNDPTPQQDIFGYFGDESNLPLNLEEYIFAKLETKEKRKTIRMRLYSLSSAAAVIVILLSIYLDFRNTKIEDDFFVMEQALFQISESIQPDIQEEMFVLWIDDDVEIIIN
ncbi:MAG: hypothetical protein HQ522_13030 [Bacteroidetes bacterium]|nr:hypothetical protein [Bacteroidota bacterium]